MTGSLESVSMFSKVMKNWYKDNPPTQAKINAMIVVASNWEERYNDLVEVLEKWYFVETLMREEDSMTCKDMKIKVRNIIDDSKKDKKFRGQHESIKSTTLLDNQMRNATQSEKLGTGCNPPQLNMDPVKLEKT